MDGWIDIPLIWGMAIIALGLGSVIVLGFCLSVCFAWYCFVLLWDPKYEIRCLSHGI